MQNNRMRTRLMATSMITGVALLGATSTAAYAADAKPTDQQGTNVGEVVITGSRIPTPNLTSVSPISSVNSTDVKLQGTTTVEDLINELPQAVGDFGNYESNGASGTATIDLRGLGNQRTLVLVNGLRLMPGDPTRGAVAPDINIIPPALIDRVEVLTGGASAVYGSDAVAGVVNFIMDKNFEGLRIDEESSFAQYDGGNKQVRQANQNGISSAALGTAVPAIHFPGSAFDGWRQTVTVIGGVNAPDDKGNAEFYFGYTHIDPVNEGKRDYSICSLATNTGNNVPWCAGSVGTTATGRLNVHTPGLATTGSDFTILGAPVGGLMPAFTFAQAFNYAPYNYFQRPDERWTAGQFSHYEFSPMFEVYSSFMFMDDHSVAAIAPSGSFFGDRIFQIPCNDPLLSSAQANTICGGNAGVAGAFGQAAIGRRNVEGLPRLADFEHMDYRMQIGARGDLGDGWRYDLSGQFGRSVLTESQPGYFSYNKLTNALNVVTDTRAGSPTLGQPVCASVIAKTDLSCVPYNLWSTGGVTQNALNYLYATAADNGATQEQVVTLTFSNPDLSRYGLKSPMAHDGLGFSGGYEYRSEDLNLVYDAAIQSGDLGGFGGALRSTHGNQSDNDLFFEARAPLVQDAPFAKDLDLEAGYRYANYTHGGGANAFKFGIDWQTVPDLRFRASFEQAVRAPNVEELFEPGAQNLFAGSDPCAGKHPKLTADQCANTYQNVLPGITGAQLINGTYLLNGVPVGQLYGKLPSGSAAVAQCPASQCGTFVGGNPGLKPETADTYSVGFVLTPSFFKNFSLSIDYWNIKVDQAIIDLPAQALLTNCATLGNAFDCSLVQRFPQNGYTIFGGNTINFGDNAGGVVYAKLVNASSLKTDGVDVDGKYRMNLDDWGAQGMGSVVFDFNGTWLNHLTTTLPDKTSYECAGLYGIVCGVPTPHWRHTFRVTWNSPWNASFSANWRFIGGSSLDFNTSQADVQNGFKDTLPSDAHISDYSYLDLAVTWRVKDHVVLRGGVNNVLGTTPPLVDANSFGISAPPFGNGNTFPQVYDPLGRVLFLGLTADF